MPVTQTQTQSLSAGTGHPDDRTSATLFTGRRTIALLVTGACAAGAVGAVGLRIDLAVYRMGGDALLHGRPLYGEVMPRTGLPFTYPPFAAFLFAPIAALPQWTAQALWGGLLFVCLAFFVRELADAAGLPGRPLMAATAGRPFAAGGLLVGTAAVVLACEPVRQNFGFGQVNLPLALMVLLDLRGRSGRLPSGVLLGLAGAIKLTPMIFLPYLLLVGRWRAAAVASATFLGCGALSALPTATDSHLFWTKLVVDPSYIGGTPYAANQSLCGVLTRIAGHAIYDESWYRAVILAVAAAGLILAALVTRRGDALLGWTVCGLTGLLVSPVSWTHHWLWALAAVAWLAAPGRIDGHTPSPASASSPARRALLAAAVGTVLLLVSPVWWVPNTRNREYTWSGWQLVAGNSYFLAAAAFLLAIGVKAAIGPSTSDGRRTSPRGRRPPS
ncbi:glycosyltransferase 87 family protein [Frankia sp. AgB32]|uniref:glycosyltransferase 87 family protein n=1 Tax=Frankia sp. AgB32 TaxID=631119 RepID=UPI00200F891E|nr:glycosyltransferase 87 family protein [Frankia sp. AgB32]MCK9897830.1 glycosyltransferase 87 family protein [Frankia sp. AgB32]